MRIIAAVLKGEPVFETYSVVLPYKFRHKQYCSTEVKFAKCFVVAFGCYYLFLCACASIAQLLHLSGRRRKEQLLHLSGRTMFCTRGIGIGIQQC